MGGLGVGSKSIIWADQTTDDLDTLSDVSMMDGSTGQTSMVEFNRLMEFPVIGFCPTVSKWTNKDSWLLVFGEISILITRSIWFICK